MAEEELHHLGKTEKAAVLLLCMDEQATQQLFDEMDDDEIRRICNALLHLNKIPTEQIQAVMEEFTQDYVKRSVAPKDMNAIELNPHRAVENLVQRSVSRGRGNQILTQMDHAEDTEVQSDGDFEQMIKSFNADTLYDLLGDEHPQILALALSYTSRKVMKDVLERLPEELQVDVIGRIARLEKVSEQIVTEIKNSIVKKIDEMKREGGVGDAKKKKEPTERMIEGLSKTVKLLKSIEKDKSMKLVDELEKLDSEIADEVNKLMFTLEDLLRADDVGIRELLRGVSNDDLKVALKNTDDAIKEKIFGNMSERAAMILREDMEVLPPLKVEEIERSQENILKVAKDLIKEEKMNLSEIPDDEE